VRDLAVFVLAGGLLFLLSLFVYRRGFAALRAADRRFVTASALCLVGTFGFLLLLVAAAVIVGSSDQLLGCADGRPTEALACLRSGQPLGVWTAIAGLALGWVGGVGLVVGLALAGRRFHRASVGAASVLYAVLLLVIAGPVLAALKVVPAVDLVLLAVPVLALVAPALVLGGMRSAAAAVPGRA